MALISTLIPTYRRPHLLRRAINSALRQSFSDIEVCVFDNASGDETGDVVREIANTDPRVRYFCHAENVGVFRNFIYAMNQVGTEYFSFLSDDDVLVPGFYESAISGFKENSEAAFVAAKTISFGDGGQYISTRPKRLTAGLYHPPEGFEVLIKMGLPIWTGVLFRKEAVGSMGSLDPNAGLRADQEYLLRIASRHPFLVIDAIGALYSSPSYKEGSKDDLLVLPDGHIYLYKKIANEYGLPKKLASIANKRLSEKYLTRLKKAMIEWIANGDQEKIRKAINILKMHGCHISRLGYSLVAFLALNSSTMKRFFQTHRVGRMKRKQKRKIEKEMHLGKDVKNALEYLEELSSDCGLAAEGYDMYFCRRVEDHRQ